MSDNQDKKENYVQRTPEGRVSAGEQAVKFNKENEPKIEKREISSDERVVMEELKREIDIMDADEKLKLEAEKKAKKIEFLGEKEKIEHLLQMAREKGVFHAVQVARKMNEPYILDVLHDVLAREGYYKKLKFSSGNDDDQKT